MRNYRGTVLLLSLLAIGLPIGLGTFRSQSTECRQNARPAQAILDKTKWPVVAYDAPGSADAKLRSIRESRGKRYDKSMFRVHPLDPSDTTYLTHSDTDLLPPLPVTQSNAILISEVLDAKAYLSDDKTGVYSEFTVRVEEVLKSDGEPSVAQGDSIAVQRQGGRVQFSSGQIHMYFVSKENMPEVGQRYIFFLKGIEAEQAFRLLTGYVLIDGKVFPLDEHKQFETHKGADLATFINEIKRVIIYLTQDKQFISAYRSN